MQSSPFKRIELPAAGRSAPRAFLLEINPSLSELVDFAEHGIACPPSVMRSVQKRRAEYLAGRRTALAALAEQGVLPCDIGISDTRAPIWPAGWLGSISHSDRLAAAVVLPDRDCRGVGIDIENRLAEAAIDAVGRAVVDKSEKVHLESMASMHGWSMAKAVAFSAKESFYKSTAPTIGKFFDFDAARIIQCRPDAGVISLETTSVLSFALQPGTRFCVGFTFLDDSTVMTSCLW